MAKIIFTNGTFDLLHLNHIKFLKKAKKLGNYLIVGLSSDELVMRYKRKSICNYDLRYRMIKELNLVDEIIKMNKLTSELPIDFYREHNITYQVQVDCDSEKYYNRKDINFIFINPEFGLHTTNILNKINNKIKKICLVGGTATTHYLGAILGEKLDFEVNILTRRPNKWKNKLSTYDINNNLLSQGKIEIISSNPQIVSQSDIILISLPSFTLDKIIQDILPFINENTIIGKIPGTGGFDWTFFKYNKTKNITIFGTQRLPLVVRVKKYGESCILYGRKKKIPFACIPHEKNNIIKNLLEEIFTYECICLPNYLSVTLTPSNSILHTSRLYSLFKDWNNKVYNDPINFYEDWDEVSLINLKGCDNEVQLICRELKDINGVLPLEKSYIDIYKDDIIDKTNLLTMIKTNKSYKGILTPMVKKETRYIPDFESRYLTEDIPFGLLILKAIALILKIDTPYFDKILLWGQKVINKEYLVNNKLIGKDINEVNIPQLFGIYTKDDLINFKSLC